MSNTATLSDDLEHLVRQVKLQLGRQRHHQNNQGLDVDMKCFQAWHDVLRQDLFEEFDAVRQQCGEQEWWYLLSENFIYHPHLDGYTSGHWMFNDVVDYLRFRSDYVYPLRYV